MRAFVTGASGFVGSAVVRCLLHRGVAVRVLARPTSDLRNLAGLNVELFYGDLLDASTLVEGQRGCDTLYHVAAYYSTDEADARRMYAVNVRGTKLVLEAALKAGVRRAVHTSTIGTVGQPTDGTLATEETAFDMWETASHYAKSKYLAERVAMNMGKRGLEVVVVNPCAPVGPRDIKPSSTGQRIVDYLQGKLPSFVPGGINFVSVADVAEGHILATEKGLAGERYILGHMEGNLLLPAFLALMQRVSGVRSPSLPRSERLLWPWQHKGAAAGKDHRPQALACDPSKAVRQLGLPQTPLEKAFGEAIAWFRDNGYVRA